MVALILLCLHESINEEYREASSSRLVNCFLDALQAKRWKLAASYCTPEAQVQGVPAEEPEKRWTKSISAYLAEQPRWRWKPLHGECLENDGSATVLVDGRQEHLTIRCRFDLVRLQNHWKIEGLRYSTRRDAPGSEEQWKRLQGHWEWKHTPKENNSIFLKHLSLDLQPKQFAISTTTIAITLFGPAQPDRETYYQDWRVRLLPQGNQWFLQLEWPGTYTTEGLLAQYECKGDELVLHIRYLGDRRLEQHLEPCTIVLKRKAR